MKSKEMSFLLEQFDHFISKRALNEIFGTYSEVTIKRISEIFLYESTVEGPLVRY